MPKFPMGQYPKESLQFFQGDWKFLDSSWDMTYLRLASMAYLMEKHGVDLRVAAATSANADTECGGPFFWDPTVLGDRGKALGLFQWHPDRQVALFEFATALGVDVYTRTLQLDFAMQEMGLYAGSGAARLPGHMQRGWARKHVTEAPTVRSAAAMFSKYFEGPKDVENNMANRGEKAARYASAYISAPADEAELVWIERARVNLEKEQERAEEAEMMHGLRGLSSGD